MREMLEYPELDAALALAREELKEAVDDEIESLLQSFLWQLTTDESGVAIVRAWTPEDDEMTFEVSKLAASCADGVTRSVLPGDEWVLREAESVAQALEDGASLIRAALVKRA